MKQLFKKQILCWSIIAISISSIAQIPNGYYNGTENLTGTQLQSKLHTIIDDHDALSYSQTWDAYYTTDKKANGKVWDMYSDVPNGTTPYNFTFGSDQCGSYSDEGDCYNREHTFPQSWFNEQAPMKSDLFHLYPTDGYVNNRRSNYPMGDVGSASWTSENGCKLGSCSNSGYSGTVFEPIDEYKGDFARSFFYMAVRYYNEDNGWDNTD
ncbi:MAG: endonuclease, partial [Bacteroidales bacterium]|nr:endonuclease [Bacteroidales bacterium]